MTETRNVHTVPRRASVAGSGLVRFLQLERAYLNEQDKRGICERVREARIESGLNEVEIAEMLDPAVTDRTIRNYESHRPPFRYLRQWAEITNVSYYWLLRGGDEPRVVPAPGADVLEVRQRLEEVAGMVARGFLALDVPPDALQPPGEVPPLKGRRTRRR